jgi:putative ABC transport system ATP-binding protein
VGSQSQEVLNSLTVDIYEHDFTVIMGASGAGKTTLLYALSGMDQVTSGSVRFFSHEIQRLSADSLALFRRRYCGFVFQQVFLLDNLTVLDNILVSGLLLRRNRKAIVRRAKELLGRVGLDKSAWNKFPTQLSGGESQRAAIVRALINKPRIVFADEPTGSLNSAAGQTVLDVLTDVNEDGQSVVMVTHDITSALRGSRILYIKDGVLCGECVLGPYVGHSDLRHRVLQTFLSRMGW